MDSRKMTLAVTIAVLALIGIGIGFAYTAMTTNSGNSAGPEYITLTQVDSNDENTVAAYTFAKGVKILFDTENKLNNEGNDIVTTYHLSNNVNTGVADGYTVVQVGNPIILNASQNVGVGSDLNCYFTTTNFAVVNEWKFFITVENGTASDNMLYTQGATANSWDNDGDDTTDTDSFVMKCSNAGNRTYTPVIVKVYFGYQTGYEPTTKPSDLLLNSATITFTADNGKHNDVGLEVTFASPIDNTTNLSSAISSVEYYGEALTLTTDYTVEWFNSFGQKLDRATFAEDGLYKLVITGVNTGKFHGVAEFELNVSTA